MSRPSLSRRVKKAFFGSRVRVTNEKTGESAIVIINDRGPFVGERIIDLSRAAAKAAGVWRPGIALQWLPRCVLGDLLRNLKGNSDCRPSPRAIYSQTMSFDRRSAEPLPGVVLTGRQYREQQFYEEYSRRTAPTEICFDPILDNERRPWNPYWFVCESVMRYFTSSDQKVLDFGCGPGVYSLLWAARFLFSSRSAE